MPDNHVGISLMLSWIQRKPEPASIIMANKKNEGCGPIEDCLGDADKGLSGALKSESD